jgi:hypothetical protein
MACHADVSTATRQQSARWHRGIGWFHSGRGGGSDRLGGLGRGYGRGGSLGEDGHERGGQVHLVHEVQHLGVEARHGDKRSLDVVEHAGVRGVIGVPVAGRPCQLSTASLNLLVSH